MRPHLALCDGLQRANELDLGLLIGGLVHIAHCLPHKRLHSLQAAATPSGVCETGQTAHVLKTTWLGKACNGT